MHVIGNFAIMGKSSMVELGNHREVKNDKVIWDILGKGGIHQYLKKGQGHDPTIEDFVISSSKDDWAKIKSVWLNLTMGAIVEANELSLEGRMFKRNSKVKLKKIQTFFDLSEELARKWVRINHVKLL